MPISNRDRYPEVSFFNESNFLEIGTRSDGAKILQIGAEGDSPVVAFAYTSNPINEDLHAVELWSLMKFSQDPNEYSFYDQPVKLNQDRRVVHKYTIPEQGEFSLDLSPDAEILTVQLQNQSACMWVLLTPRMLKQKRDFVWIPTGKEIEYGNIDYITTIQFNDGKKVSHLFELKLDYSELEKFLVEGEWREADLATFRILGNRCGINASPDGEQICQDGISAIPLVELKAIDKLWSRYSNGHFGYTAQLSITRKIKYSWENAERNQKSWSNFCDQVGWNTGFSALNFSLEAPKGHLPATVAWGMGFGPPIFEEIYKTLWSQFNG